MGPAPPMGTDSSQFAVGEEVPVFGDIIIGELLKLQWTAL